MAGVLDIVRMTPESSKQLAILRAFISDPGFYTFDSMTSTKSVSSIIAQVSFSALIFCPLVNFLTTGPTFKLIVVILVCSVKNEIR